MLSSIISLATCGNWHKNTVPVSLYPHARQLTIKSKCAISSLVPTRGDNALWKSQIPSLLLLHRSHARVQQAPQSNLGNPVQSVEAWRCRQCRHQSQLSGYSIIILLGFGLSLPALYNNYSFSNVGGDSMSIMGDLITCIGWAVARPLLGILFMRSKIRSPVKK